MVEIGTAARVSMTAEGAGTVAEGPAATVVPEPPEETLATINPATMTTAATTVPMAICRCRRRWRWRSTSLPCRLLGRGWGRSGGPGGRTTVVLVISQVVAQGGRKFPAALRAPLSWRGPPPG